MTRRTSPPPTAILGIDLRLGCAQTRQTWPDTALVNVFLGNSHDKAIAEGVAFGVLDVAKELLAKG